LARSISDNPRPTIQDGLLLASVLLVGALLALQYNLFWFSEEPSEPQRKVSLAEALALTVLLGLCLFAFAARRLRDVRYDAVRRDAIADATTAHDGVTRSPDGARKSA
jgi:hypothetical protein